MKLFLFKGSIVCFLFAFLFFTSECYAQNTYKPTQKFLYYFDFTQNNLIRYTKSRNIEKTKFIDEHAFATGKYLGFDKNKLMKNIIALYPNKSDSGYCYIDLESPYIDALIEEMPTSKKFKESLDYYILIITEAKRIRPKVKWGYYGIPLTTYWDIDREFYEKQHKLKPLFEVCDIFFPSMYFFYADDGTEWTSMNERFVKKNTQELIKLATKYNKPVFPFIMERYHPSNPHNKGMQKIPEPEFIKYTKMILDESYNNKKVDGIVWWNADRYYYQTTLGYEKELQTLLRKNNSSNLELMKKINKIINR